MLRRPSARPSAPSPASPAVLAALALAVALFAPAADAASIRVSYPESVAAGPLDGRVIVLLSTREDDEPRFQVTAGIDAIQIFGVDVGGLAAGTAVPVGAEATGDRPAGDRPASYGYPHLTVDDVPPGRYRVQAVLHRYETFHRADGHRVKLPMDRGEGQHWNRAPGNLYSEPRWIDLPADGAPELVLDQVIPPIEPPADTEHVKHIRIRSALLSEFWGRDMYLGAHVLLPEGWSEDPDERYPLMVFHGHFPSDFGGFRTEPPDPDLECQDSARFGVACYNRIVQREAYDFYRQWTSPGFPRFLVVEIQHANPYYDDSYAVNSANLGPYGDAINHELIPEIERRFRGIGEGWSRFLYGGSTGGWEALAVQVFYPDEFNGAFAACPDPIDFRAYTTVDLYGHDNAYRGGGPFRKVDRPAHRDWLGHVQATVEDYNHMELALGSRGRSGDQFDIWEAVYSPVADDGYPARVWDKVTGEIDPEVAAHWREHYDLSHILARDWEELGPKLAGKIHLYVGDMDNYYLNDAVYLAEDFLEATTDPYYGGEVAYGDRAEHCWNGDPEHGNHLSRLRYNTMYLPKITKRLEATAPEGFDLGPWREWTRPKATVVRAAGMIDVVAGTRIADPVLVIEGDTIRAVGTATDPPDLAELPPGAEELDLGDLTLLPGLIDLHTHLTYDPRHLLPDLGDHPSTPAATHALVGAESARATLEAGITTVRDLGACCFADVTLGEAIDQGIVAGPRIFPSGYVLTIQGGGCDQTLAEPRVFDGGPEQGTVASPEEIVRAIRHQVRYGARVIKACVDRNQFSEEEIRVMAEEAHRRGVKLATHVNEIESVRAAVLGGADTLEHVSHLDDDLIAEMLERGTVLVATIHVSTSYDFDKLPERVRETVRREFEENQPQWEESLRRAIAAGVTIGFGSDTGEIAHGENARELTALVRYGMTPADALRSATVVGAQVLDVDDRGVIEAGKLADLIAVAGDPLTDVSLLEDVRWVMKGGEVVKGGSQASAARTAR